VFKQRAVQQTQHSHNLAVKVEICNARASSRLVCLHSIQTRKSTEIMHGQRA
jgi:hypothetical protein